MAGERRGGRDRGKSDPIDALAVARLAQRENGGAKPLPAGQLDDRTHPIRQLTDYRDVLVKDRTAMINRLRWQLHEPDPALAPGPGTLIRALTRRQLAARLAALPAAPKPSPWASPPTATSPPPP
jgi:transposase